MSTGWSQAACGARKPRAEASAAPAQFAHAGTSSSARCAHALDAPTRQTARSSAARARAADQLERCPAQAVFRPGSLDPELKQHGLHQEHTLRPKDASAVGYLHRAKVKPTAETTGERLHLRFAGRAACRPLDLRSHAFYGKGSRLPRRQRLHGNAQQVAPPGCRSEYDAGDR